jgi:hypothetical protein
MSASRLHSTIEVSAEGLAVLRELHKQVRVKVRVRVGVNDRVEDRVKDRFKDRVRVRVRVKIGVNLRLYLYSSIGVSTEDSAVLTQVG